MSLALLGFYLVQGWRYMQAAEDSSALGQEIRDSERSIARMVQDGEATSLEPEAQELQWPVEVLRGIFRYQSTENLIVSVAAIAWETEVELISMTPDSPRTEVVDNLQYRVQALSVSVRAATADLQRFLLLLHTNVPVVVASELNVAGFSGVPETQAQLLFYLSPDPIEEAEQEQAG